VSDEGDKDGPQYVSFIQTPDTADSLRRLHQMTRYHYNDPASKIKVYQVSITLLFGNTVSHFVNVETYSSF